MAVSPFSDRHRVKAPASAGILLQIENPSVKTELSLRFRLAPEWPAAIPLAL
jgi:hypothetical protein